MGLEFKPYLEWEEEEARARAGSAHKQVHQHCNGEVENQQTMTMTTHHHQHHQQLQNQQQQQLMEEEEEEEEDAPVAEIGARREEEVLLPGCLVAMNEEHREYAVLVAEEEEDVNEYRSVFSIVLDYPQFLGQGETKESALRHASRLLHHAFGSLLLKNEVVPLPCDGAQLEAKKAAMERDWQQVKLGNFSIELLPLQFQSGVDYTVRPPESDGEYESDREDEELFELESRMSTP